MKRIWLATLLVIGTALPAHAATQWQIGFHAETVRPTNVAVFYTVSCRSGDLVRAVHHRFVAQTPLSRSVAPTLSGADSCHIRVTVYDIKPWDGPGGDGQHPTVTSWVNP